MTRLPTPTALDNGESPGDVPALRRELLRLANEVFPAVAKTGDYPVRFNHCFLRIVYDNLLGARWQTVLHDPKERAGKGLPAYRRLDAGQLASAIEIGHAIIADPAHCRRLNDASLRWRGKR